MLLPNQALRPRGQSLFICFIFLQIEDDDQRCEQYRWGFHSPLAQLEIVATAQTFG